MHNMSRYKTIRIYEETFANMDKLCVKYDLQKTEIVEEFVSYFLKTGQDPRDHSDVTGEVKKLKNQLISFIKTQEKEKLNPLVSKVDISTDKLREYLENDNSYEKTKVLFKSLLEYLEKRFDKQEELINKK